MSLGINALVKSNKKNICSWWIVIHKLAIDDTFIKLDKITIPAVTIDIEN